MFCEFFLFFFFSSFLRNSFNTKHVEARKKKCKSASVRKNTKCLIKQTNKDLVRSIAQLFVQGLDLSFIDI